MWLTVAQQWSLAQGSTPVEVARWSQAAFAPMAPGYESIDLLSPSGGARVWAQGLTRDEVIDIAETLYLDGGTLTSDRLSDVDARSEQQWNQGYAGRTLYQEGADGAIVAEISITSGAGVSALASYALLGHSTVIDIDGAPGAAHRRRQRGPRSRGRRHPTPSC